MEAGERATSVGARWFGQRGLVVRSSAATAAGADDAVRVVIVDRRVLDRRLVRTQKDVQLRSSPNGLPSKKTVSQ